MSKAQVAIEWRKQRKVTFHGRHGLNIKLSSSCCVASREARVDGVREMTAVDGYGVVFSSEPVAVGCMFKVAVLESDDCFNGGVGVFFTTEDPQSSKLMGSWMAAALDSPGQKNLVGVFADKVFCGGKPILPSRSKLAKSTQSLTAGNSVGIRLVKAAGNKVLLEVYFNGELFRTVPLPNGYPLSRPLWGVVDVYGSSTKVKADVFTLTEAPAKGQEAQPQKAPISKAPSFDEATRTQQPRSPEESELARLRQLVKQLTDKQEAYQIQISQLKVELKETGQQLNVAKEQFVQEQVAHREEAHQLKIELNEAKSQLQQRQATHGAPFMANGWGRGQTYQQLKNMEHRKSPRTISGQDVWLMYY